MALHSDWLSALAAFEAAARHQNFAHAGEELHLTASAAWARLAVDAIQRLHALAVPG